MTKRPGEITRSNSGSNYSLFAKETRQRLLVLLGVCIAAFVAIKALYPYPLHCLTDANGYLYAAVNHWKANYRPYGYSGFLNLVYGINSRLWFLGFVQYLLYLLSTTLFVYTVDRFFSLSKVTFYILSVLCILSPVPLYFSNYAISDSLFCSLTIAWIVTGIWLFRYPRVWMVAAHLLVMLLAIYVRYAGLVYPIISSLLFLLAFSKVSFLNRAFIFFLPLIVFMLFYLVQRNAMKRETGVGTFSGFSGWSLANNSVCILPFVRIDEKSIADPDLKLAHYYVKQFPDSVYRYNANTSTSFIWAKHYAGKSLLEHVIKANKRNYFHSWVFTGQIWGEYGAFLVKNYPLQFIRYFVFPNLKQLLYPSRVYLPPCEIEAPEPVRSRYKDCPPHFSYRYDIMARLQDFIRIGSLLGWMALVGSVFILVVYREKLALDKNQIHILTFGLLIIGFYSAFILVGHPFEQRYMMNIHTIKVSIPVIIFSCFVFRRKVV